METVMNERFVSVNLDFLEELKSCLHKYIDDYVNKTLETGRTWMSSAESRPCSFMEIYDKINRAVAFLNLKCEEIKCESLDSESLQAAVEASDVQQCSSLQMEPEVVEDSESHAPKFPKASKMVKKGLNAKQVMINRRKAIKQNLNNASSENEAEKQNLDNTIRGDFEKQLQTLLAKQDDMENKLDSKLADFRKEVDANNDIRWINYCSETQSVFSQISDRLESLESSTTGKIDAIKDSFTENQENDYLLGQKILDNKIVLSELEIKWSSDLTKVKKRLEKRESDYQTVCQLLADRLQPLEQLRSILNNNASSQNKRAKQLQSMAAKLKSVADIVKRLDSKCSSQLVGFNAEAVLRKEIKAGSTIKPFSSNTCDTDVQFNPTTGKFVASENGVYLVSVTTYDAGRSFQLVHMKTSLLNSDVGHNMYVTKGDSNDSTPFHMSLITMTKGDYLYLRMQEDSKLFQVVKFSCYRLV